MNYDAPPPHDRWILVGLDDGDESDEPRCFLARYNPKHFPELDGCMANGVAIYEWEVLRNGEFDWWSSGRISGWTDLPVR